METKSFTAWLLWISTVAASVFLSNAFGTASTVAWTVAVNCVVVLALVTFFPIVIFKTLHREKDVKSVDPWFRQRVLMIMSGQELPMQRPMMTRTVMLYSALTMEEASEAAANIAESLERMGIMHEPDDEQSLELLRREFLNARLSMHTHSTEIRRLLKQHLRQTWPGYALSLREAHALADDTTDIQVVNSAFANALGIPGALCFEEVYASNVSKRNPATGVIDKDESGKWIKGPGYWEPNLNRVLSTFFPQGTWADQLAEGPGVQLDQGQSGK